MLELTPDLVGATETQNSGIIGETVDLNLVHTGDVRPSQVVYELTSHLVLTKWRDANGEPKLHLFGQLKRIAKQWLDELSRLQGRHLSGAAQVQDAGGHGLRADHRRHQPRMRSASGPIKAVLDPYNPVGSTAHVRFNTSKS